MRTIILRTAAAVIVTLIAVSCGTDERVDTAGTTTTEGPDYELLYEYLAAVEAAENATTTTAPPLTTAPPPPPASTSPPTTAVPDVPPPAPPAPQPDPVATTGGSVWDDLAWCEAGGNWAHPPVGSYGYSGGLMFLPSTWRSYGGGEYAAAAHHATREQQIAVAERVLADVGWGAWPGCSRKLGLR